MLPDSSEPSEREWLEGLRDPRPSSVREPPTNGFDPTAAYDVQRRKQPKLLGFVEMARALPWIVARFPGRVPDFVVTEDRQAVFDCVCGEVVYAAHNRFVDCPGDCGRTFAFVGTQVRVHRECGHTLEFVGDRVILPGLKR